jgi:hypothetical protein
MVERWKTVGPSCCMRPWVSVAPSRDLDLEDRVVQVARAAGRVAVSISVSFARRRGGSGGADGRRRAARIGRDRDSSSTPAIDAGRHVQHQPVLEQHGVQRGERLAVLRLAPARRAGLRASAGLRQAERAKARPSSDDRSGGSGHPRRPRARGASAGGSSTRHPRWSAARRRRLRDGGEVGVFPLPRRAASGSPRGEMRGRAARSASTQGLRAPGRWSFSPS